MCKFISTVPENYLHGRKIQIEYIKKQCPEIAKVAWQAYEPFNLYNYKRHSSPLYYLFRIIRKSYNIFLSRFINSNCTISRNWELQFLGNENAKHLKHWLFGKKIINDIVPSNLINNFYQKFLNENQVIFSHPISMLLTLSVWCEKFWKKK